VGGGWWVVREAAAQDKEKARVARTIEIQLRLMSAV